jgi:plasmid stability protein
MATITVKNIPDELYDRLKRAAASNRRSINNEVITRLEQSLAVRRTPAVQLLARLSRLHGTFGGRLIQVEQLDAARRAGRP